ncbi:G-type lectin S-receptor-like serine/threonine-protein kinase At4g27290 [Pistacia vera]|uniref:G-type lectin S-receptor-like serine/threonine-protein kinase At4g27290 n=1 Tax=Pistacia vera TaxID=55513 RepID=UPI001263935C|nr:G-type lectin S-receptor-like serine/threonine-protein kinase At4g27290 [Pistacia vera]
MDVLCLFFISFKLLLFFSGLCYATTDTISSSQSLSEGRTLVSKNQTFELGFFSPGSSKNRYLGIWYKKIPVQTVVWVANRLNPINDSSGILMINRTGNLVLMSQSTSIVWSANLTKVSSSAVVQLLDSGNLVLRDEQDGNLGTYLWQSFDYPSDTLIAEMKLGWDLKTGFERRISAWRSPDDPSPGDFTWGIELQENPEIIMRKGSTKFYRSGPWNGLGFSGSPELRLNPIFKYKFVSNEEEVYYMFNATKKSAISRIVMNETSNALERFVWNEENQSWKLYASVPRDRCDNYNLCGSYGICIPSALPICQCLEGFKSKSLESMDWYQGCIRNKPLNYSKADGFIKFDGLKVPDATHSSVNRSMNLKECREKCLENSSCMAYTNSDISGGGSGCTMWFGDLMDMKQFPAGGQDLYMRMSASEKGANDEHKNIPIIVFTTIAAVAVVAVLLLIVGYYIHKNRINLVEKTETNRGSSHRQDDPKDDLELPLFELDTISNATENFSINNKLGEGGFGPVYKGTLVDGQEIAVKRLSKISGQGLNEFTNEVILIAKLQHRNLVKLLGCCIEGDEKMLIYEFMPNNSLDSFIFDQTKSTVLDWSKRFQIICGIARGLLYLHQDSRLRIIHRDLKASNVLLDHEMNPKISDFGLARTFGGDETEGNTKRVVGTYGYMAPEYATDGLFSVKSDVFSFGILMLEIVSGSKNRGFYHPDDNHNLIGHAWKLWNEDKQLELIDSVLGDQSCNLSEAIRCIHISLLCVQQYPEDRPNMSSVVVMLGSENELPQPKQPGFLMDRKSQGPDSSLGKPESSSTNEITISLLEAR